MAGTVVLGNPGAVTVSRAASSAGRRVLLRRPVSF